MSTSSDATRLPGFGLPVDFRWLSEDGSRQYDHALDCCFLSGGVPVREQRMLEFMGQITDKVDWQRKVNDDDIVAKWKTEASREIDVNGTEDEYLSEEMFDYCMKELRDKAEYMEKTGIVTVLDSELYIAKSDTLVPAELLARLKEAVALLEDVPESKKDWHPGSDEKVLDLLHPSLFPLRYGLTRVLPSGKVPLDDCLTYIGKGEVTEPFDPSTVRSCYDLKHAFGKHQWLPSDLKWTPEGLEIASYVNNLHPRKHKDLYKILESFASLAVPLFEHVVLRSSYTRTEQDLAPRIEIEHTSHDDYYVPDDILFTGYEKPLEEYDEWELKRRQREDDYMDWKQTVWILSQPEPETYAPRNKKNLPDFRTLFPDGLQVIFKLANIHLSPDKPEYEGGTWHIEGALNERICATVLYYYDQDNITDSHLAFRHRLDEEHIIMQPAQDEYESIQQYLGIRNYGQAIQNLGKVLTREGRMLAFPNVLQHQVQPFSLVDKTKHGHRKILAMFLVDPHLRVLSTSVVPPQRRDWWAEEVRKVPRFGKLPQEIFEMNIEQVEDFPIKWEDALKYREDLMAERTAVSQAVDDMWNEMTFSFCEH
ncbi:uncharacterized protein B0I36DRAFT_357895 [Microdochium trichocladiopsis]|uniref:Duf1665 domain containing protein n=1 Tax=Microdochium trichocladiopsis TaxID=1682393 RepID=A0A9P8YF44_9PEZI|nr:uncharacterized protein B0I36DRAFT_357895 [Microdochium trichocladiopsis]KAH7040622.1 hypothetical protein B0I36DRAFT_357895 [Microdochium trichocladiopsis]